MLEVIKFKFKIFPNIREVPGAPKFDQNRNLKQIQLIVVKYLEIFNFNLLLYGD